MDGMQWRSQNNFMFGEVGNRLDGNRSSEVYDGSAKIIRNGYVTPTGHIRAFKRWENVTGIFGEIITALDTRYPFYVVVSTNGIYILDVNTHDVISSHSVSIQQGANCSIFANTRLAVIVKGDNKFFEFSSDGSQIIDIDYFDLISPPLRNREPVTVDVHRVYEIEEIVKVTNNGDYEKEKYKTIERISDTVLNPIVTVDSIGRILIDEVAGTVARIYGEPLRDFRMVYTDDIPEGEERIWTITKGSESDEHGFKGDGIDQFGATDNTDWEFTPEEPPVSVGTFSASFVDTITNIVNLRCEEGFKLYESDAFTAVFNGVPLRLTWDDASSQYTGYSVQITNLISSMADGDTYVITVTVQPPTDEEGDVIDDNINIGDLILNFPNGLPDNLMLNGKVVGFINENTELGRFYYEGLDSDPGRGRLYRGEIIELEDTLTSVSVFQNRLVFTDEDTIYFSEVNNYTNFTNFVDDTSPFYIRPNPISNQQPEIRNSYSSRGLFVVTDRGIYSIGYNVAITPANSSVDTITDMPSTNKVTMIDFNFFFIGEDGNLYSIQELAETTSQRLYQFVVEKYQIDFKPTSISTLRLDKYNRLIVSTGEDVVYMYDVIGTDEFRRISFDLEHTGLIFGIRDFMISDNLIHDVGSNNYPTMTIKVHQPAAWTPEGGNLFNEENSTVYVTQCSLINEDGDQVESVTMSNETVRERIHEELVSYYRSKTQFRFKKGFNYEINTTEGTKAVELSALEFAYEIGGI